MVRVAAVQFATGIDVSENLHTVLRMIDRAAEARPALMVLPEFSNHLSWYDDMAHCHRVSLSPGDAFLSAVADKARQHRCYLVINVSMRREAGAATVTSVLFDPEGEVKAEVDKQTLMGHENDYFRRADKVAPVVPTPFGRVGIYPCRDGVTMETARGLCVRGAQILCNSLNSFALDEASLHVPARAPENRAFVVAANKVGPLIPAALLEAVSAATQIPVEFLHGAGESQIVAPDGRVLARGPRGEEAVVVADIDVTLADDKQRSDGTDVLRARRPALYAALRAAPRPDAVHLPGAASIAVAAYVPERDGAAVLDEVVAVVAREAQAGTQLLVLPELFCFEGGAFPEAPDASAVERSRAALARLQSACGASALTVATSVIEPSPQGSSREGYRHVGVLVGAAGVLARQRQLHVTKRHGWLAPGDAVETFALPWGRLGLVVGDDAIFPETVKLLALQHADVIAVVGAAREAWELRLGLASRAAENRVCIVSASRPSEAGASVLLDLHKDFTIMTPWESRVFDGNISLPISHARPGAGLLRGSLHPACASNKLMSKNTHLLDGRPFLLVDALTDG